MHSAVLIIPAALKAHADAIGEAMGWGPTSYTIALSADDGETVTHFGARADVGPGFLRLVAGIDPLPDTIGAQAALVLGALIVDFSPDPAHPDKPALWGGAHFEAVCEAHGLTRHEG
jgi:hypothetical protein